MGSTNREAAPGVRDRARRRLVAVRKRYEASWPGEIGHQLKALDFVNWITIFGASLLWSALPLIILLSSLADTRIDDDLSRHIGLNGHGAHIVETLFRSTPAHGVGAILTGFLFCFTGVVAVVSSLTLIYERIFGQEPRGWHNLPRGILWIAALFALLAFDGLTNHSERAAGHVVLDLVGLVTTTLFFWWSLHFLLAGRVPWRRLVRPALVSGLLWFGFALFSSLYFSSTVISDRHTYGTIGVVFSLLTWFFLIGGVVVLGAVLGAVWQSHAEHP
ncbi:MAG: YhjD/YihY/BrkB family envelope integrity protein [Solirubrobacteraceae bacterium]